MPPRERSSPRSTRRRRSSRRPSVRHLGYEYSRASNPTRVALERCLASLEGARHGFAFASGMAAVDAVLRGLGPKDHVILPWQGYGGTWRLVTSVLPVAFDTVDQADLGALAAAWRPGDPHGAGGVAHQPHPRHRRHRRRRPLRPRARGPVRGRQHLRHAVPADAAGPRRRRRRPLDHQVPGRPLRRHRRVRGVQRRRPGCVHRTRPAGGRRRARPASTASWSCGG